MSELARRSDLPVPTIKYYLREGLLHHGEAVGATRAQYDESHVRRLRLIRALTEVAGMRLDDVRRVLDAIDDESLSWHEAIGSAHARLAPPVNASGSDAERPGWTPCWPGTTGSSPSRAGTATHSPARWPRSQRWATRPRTSSSTPMPRRRT